MAGGELEEKVQGVIDRAYTTHVSAVGEVAYHWNLLHEQLGVLFSIAAAINNQIGMAVWYSVQSDRAQRDMLLAALRANNEEVWNLRPKAKDDIKWLANYVTSPLADRRNDAIHAPCEVSLNVYEDGAGGRFSKIEVTPSYFLGNPRATKLSTKALLDELTWYADTAQALSRYATAMVRALTEIETPWPERPRLPSLGQSRSRK